MKLVILVAVALAAVAVAAPTEPSEILRYELDQQPDGSFASAFETDDGTVVSSNGELKQVNDEENKPRTILVLRGTYSYVKPDGTREDITYFADETGYHADGPSIPKAPVARR